MYRFALLDPRPGENRNQGLLGLKTLGIEVTVPWLARHCGLGNIDPQHTGQNIDLAAIEAALEFPLPPDGTILVTIRPDCDAFGAMAVLKMRATGTKMKNGILSRVTYVAKRDRFEVGQWPGPRSLPENNPEPSPFTVMSAVCNNNHLSVDQRVIHMQAWLETAEEPPDYRDKVYWASYIMLRDIRDGKLPLRTMANGKIATAIGDNPGLVSLAYYLAPVVVVHYPIGPNGKSKFSICQYHKGFISMDTLVMQLQAHEPDWGGSSTRIGSPQGIGSSLSPDAVVEMVKRHLI
ncbi:MAG: hypothetical protein WCT08_03535 [Patescibacteria group bacterium]|jgi:hypothetical protein